MIGTIGNNRQEESMEAKTLWFCTLSILDRIEMLCSVTDIALTINPGIQDKRNVKSITGRIQILELPMEDIEPL